MRILQISSARTLGGGERHFADLCNGLARRGHEVHAALRPGSALGAELTAIPAERIFTLPLRNALDLPSAIALARLARERRCEIVHAHLARDYTLAAFAARRAAGSRLVVTRHVLFPLGRAHKIFLGDVSRVIAVSGAVARSLRARGIFPEERIRVVRNGVDVERFETASRRLDREAYRRSLGARASLIVGTVGELSEVKGQEDFVRAASVIAREIGDVEFLVVGEDASRSGRNRARLEALVSELGLRGRVHLVGRRADVAEILACLDVFVSPSRSEAFGLAIAEAMAAGACVVATATEGAREVVEDGMTGLLVPAGDTSALASVVVKLLGDEGLRARLRDGARSRARELWSLERMVEETERVYAEASG